MSAEVKMTDNTDELLKELEFLEEKALVTVGGEAEGDAKIEIESSPRRVDTGRLRNSITWATRTEHSEVDTNLEKPNDDASADDGVNSSQAGEREVVIGTNVEYAAKVHEGDAKEGLDPNRFLRNAIERNSEKYRGIIDDTLRGMLTSG